MPSAADFQTEALARNLTAKYVMLVAEHIGRLQPSVDANTRETLDADDYHLHFTVGPVASSRTLIVSDIYTELREGSQRLYFLPWCQNAATEMTIPAGDDGPSIFMTSMLSGCTVQVHGTATNPTVTHANGSKIYNNTYTDAKAIFESTGMTGKTLHIQTESRANHACTGAINGMLPDPMGAMCGTVTKMDYALKVTNENLLAAKKRFYKTMKFGRRFKKFEMDSLGGGFKPKTGAFVFGLRNHLDQWKFFYQAIVELKVSTAGWFGLGKSTKFLNESAVLGPPKQFFPPR
ncbi:MAG: hypothetical protein RPU64_00155 [Candidatus Sedimenticola sp. (ex Thyasira tokunagai)]